MGNMIQEHFIEILNSYLHIVSPNLPRDVDWEAVFEIAKRQEVSGIVYKECRTLLPEKIRKSYERTWAAAVYFYLRRVDQEKQIRAALRSAGIPFLFVKGTEVASLYPDPELRTMGDMDLLVRSEDKIRAGDVLLALGFKKTIDTNEWVFLKDKLEIELHHDLAYPRDQFSCANVINECWNYTWTDTYGDQHLIWEFHLLYLLFHLRRHMLFGGVGFRQFIDIALVCKNTEIDWTRFKELAEKTELLNYAGKVFAFNERWFGIVNPFGNILLDERFYTTVTEKVFNDGVFGHGNGENILNQIGTISVMKGVNLKKAQKEYLLTQMFPSYAQMKCWAQYSYLQGRRYLLPLAWVHRFFRRIVDPKKRKNFKDRVFVAEEYSLKRIDTLKQWGL